MPSNKNVHRKNARRFIYFNDAPESDKKETLYVRIGTPRSARYYRIYKIFVYAPSDIIVYAIKRILAEREIVYIIMLHRV